MTTEGPCGRAKAAEFARLMVLSVSGPCNVTGVMDRIEQLYGARSWAMECGQGDAADVLYLTSEAMREALASGSPDIVLAALADKLQGMSDE